MGPSKCPSQSYWLVLVMHQPCHPCTSQTINSIPQILRWRDMCTQVKAYVKSCNECQNHKIVGKPNCRQIPFVLTPCNQNPFKKVHVDCVGPCTVCIQSETEIEYLIHILFMFNTCTNWCKLALIPMSNSQSCTLFASLISMTLWSRSQPWQWAYSGENPRVSVRYDII